MFEPSERVTQMKKNFMHLHEEGKTIPEIAMLYSLHRRTVYMHLQSIADEYNVERDSLLSYPKKAYKKNIVFIKHRNNDININELRNSYSDIQKSIDTIISRIDNILK